MEMTTVSTTHCRNILALITCLLVLGGVAAHAEVSQRSTAQLFADAAAAREEAAGIWENMGDPVKAAAAWAEAAAAWQKAADAYEAAGDHEKAQAAWEKFRQALARRDTGEIRLKIVSGNNQKVRVQRTSEPLAVKVTDAAGRPAAGVTVLFDIALRPGAGDGSGMVNAQAVTDSDGVATARLRVGTQVGKFAITAVVPNLSREPAVFELEALCGPAAKLQILSGNNQVMKVNQKALSPLVVKITDLYGNGVEGARAQFRIVSEPDGAVGQSLSAGEVATDASGICGVRFQAGHLGGSYIVLVESGDLEGSPAKFELIVRQTIPTIRITAEVLEGIPDTPSLLAGSRIKAGETYLLPDIGRLAREELKRLYTTGRFDDVYVLIDQKREDEGILIVKLRERPKVSQVKLVGLKRVKEEDLRGVIGLADGSPYSASAVERTRVAIQDYLEAEGYRQATVTVETSVVTVVDSGDVQRVSVTYRVVEKEKIKIGAMRLHGNRAFSSWNINWHMKTGSGRVYKETEFEEDRQKIMARYYEKGYLSATMSDPVITFDNRGRMILDVTIDEGPQYRIGDVTFVGNTVLTADELLWLMKPARGEVFRARKFYTSIERMRLQTARMGYAEARVIPQERLDPKRGMVDFVIRVEEGQVLHLAGIEVEGNYKTQDKIIRREIRLETGQVIDGDELERSRKRLEGLGFFEAGSVKMYLKPVPGGAPDQRILMVKVAEGRTGQLQFGGGYSSANGAVGFITMSKKNFDPFDLWSFTGAGQDLTIGAEIGGDLTSYNLSWTEPWFRNKPLSVGFDLYSTYQEQTGYDWWRRGGALRFSKADGNYGRYFWRYDYEAVRVENIDASAPQEVRDEANYPNSTKSKRRSGSVTLGYSHDTRDDNMFPMQGHFWTFSNEVAAKPLGGNVSFYRPTVTYSWFHPVMTKHVFAIRCQYATLSNFFDKNNPIPATEKYYTGGSDSIRGYPERSIEIYDANGNAIGPGRSMTLANIEYRIPFTDDKSMSMALFSDMGGVFAKSFDFKPGELVYSVGAGVRLSTPLGAIRLDYGYGFNFPHKNKPYFHFSMGQMF